MLINSSDRVVRANPLEDEPFRDEVYQFALVSTVPYC